MQKLPSLTIHLKNASWYTQLEQQHEVWLQTRKNIEESGLSHERYIEAISFMIVMLNPKVLMPLLGDIEGVQRYLISNNFFLFERRWFSYYLLANEHGHQKHSPTRLTERVRECHLANQALDELKQHFGVSRVDKLFNLLFPKHTSPLFDNVRKTTKRA